MEEKKETQPNPKQNKAKQKMEDILNDVQFSALDVLRRISKDFEHRMGFIDSDNLSLLYKYVKVLCTLEEKIVELTIKKNAWEEQKQHARKVLGINEPAPPNNKT